MGLSSLSIRRPVLTIVMALVIILFGAIGISFLGVREYPSVDPPIITVSTSYTGANSDVIESQITEPLEEVLSGIAGIKTMTSTSREGRSTISLEFEVGDDLERAANDVRDKVSQSLWQLPEDATPPVVSKADADRNPIVFLNTKSDQRDLLSLSQVAENIKERVQTIDGVSQVWIWGEKRYAMRLWMDPTKLAAYDLTPLDVRNALLQENVELPSGRIEGKSTELTVRTVGRLSTVEEFNNLVVKEVNDRVVRFRDIGHAELGPENERTVLKRDGIPMVGVVLVPQPGANYVDIANEFYKRLKSIKRDVPQDISLSIGFDTTQYIRDSISEVVQTLFVAFLLVVLVIFFFLRDWRTTLIPVLAVPISLIGAFFVMYVAGFSINILTLLGLVLAIGLVVDDAIVMLENIYAKIETGMDPMEAGKRGAAEIFFAIIATTVALIAVFLPVIFLQGFTGRLFREFGLTIAGAVLISSFVALTLTPMLASRLLKPGAHHNWFYQKTEPFFKWLARTYRNSLRSFMERRWLAPTFIVAAIGIIILVGTSLPRELAPLEDRSRLQLFATAPEGATFEYMDDYMDSLITLTEDVIKPSEREGIISLTSPGFGASGSVNSGFMNVILTDPGNRDRSQQQVANALSAAVVKLPGAQTYVTQPRSIGGGRGGLPVEYVIQAPTFDKLKAVLPKFLNEAGKQKEFQFVQVDLKFNKPELRIDINREKARVLGVSTRDIAQTLQMAFSGQRFDYFIMNGKLYQVIGQMDQADRNEPLDLRKLNVRSSSGHMIQLDNLVTLTEQSSPPQRYRFNRFVSATVSAGLAGDYTIQDGINAMNRVAGDVLDESFTTSLSGASRDYVESSSNLVFAFLLALLLVYLALSAQFESFRDPFIIMLTVPLALAGALFSLWYFNQTLNIFSQIGIIMLIGLVTKNAILIVEFANQRKAHGLEFMEAIQGAAEARFRPILMTSLTTIFGYMPIALAIGAGAESRTSMGIVVIGGLIFATVLTLYVIPVMYYYLSSREKSVSNVTTETATTFTESKAEMEEIEQ